MMCFFKNNLDEPELDTTNQPTNLLVTFLEYSSIVMRDIKGVLETKGRILLYVSPFIIITFCGLYYLLCIVY